MSIPKGNCFGYEGEKNKTFIHKTQNTYMKKGEKKYNS